MTSGPPQHTELELRPRADRFVRDALHRLRVSPSLGMLFAAALAALAAALAYGHVLSPLIIATVVAATTALGIVILGAWFAIAVFGTRWTMYHDRLVVRRPGAPRLEVPVDDLSAVRLESISGFGLHEPILKFVNKSGGIIFWTVASRWSDSDLSKLWRRLGLQPVNALDSVNDFQT